MWHQAPCPPPRPLVTAEPTRHGEAGCPGDGWSPPVARGVPGRRRSPRAPTPRAPAAPPPSDRGPVLPAGLAVEQGHAHYVVAGSGNGIRRDRRLDHGLVAGVERQVERAEGLGEAFEVSGAHQGDDVRAAREHAVGGDSDPELAAGGQDVALDGTAEQRVLDLPARRSRTFPCSRGRGRTPADRSFPGLVSSWRAPPARARLSRLNAAEVGFLPALRHQDRGEMSRPGRRETTPGRGRGRVYASPTSRSSSPAPGSP